MRSFVGWVLGAVLISCGGGSSSDEPVDITSGNLEGYWLSLPSNASEGSAPTVIHFEPEIHPSEVLEGVSHYVEGLNLLTTTATEVLGYRLDGNTLTIGATATSSELVVSVEKLTRDELVMVLNGATRTFRRVSACAGPSVWGGQSLGLVYSAEFDKFGGLHVLMSSGTHTDYAWIAPGRCTPTFPKPITVTGESLDISENGDVRVLDFTQNGGAPGEIIVTTVPAKPWARADLEPHDVIVPAPSTPAAAAPPMRAVDLDGGRFMVMYAYGAELFAVTVDGTTTSEVTTPLYQSSTFTPYRLELDRLPDGGFVVRGGRTRQGALYKDGEWSAWTAEEHAEVFAYHDGTLYAAWGSGLVNDIYNVRLTIGRQQADGSWETIAAGRGWPTHMRVQDDGSIDVVGVYERLAKSVQMWTHVPPGFAKNTWRQEYYNGTAGGFFEQYLRSFGGVFGPDGEVVTLQDQAGIRRPRQEGDTLFRSIDVTVSFDAETDVTLVLPTLGERCDTDCHVLVPPASALPVLLELPDESSAAGIASAETTTDGWSYIADPPLGAWDERAMIVSTTLRRMTEVLPLGAADVWSEPGDVVATDGGYAVSWTEGTLKLAVIEDGALVDQADFAGAGLADHALVARPDGGFVVGLSTLPTANTGGVAVLDASLDVVSELAFDVDIRRWAVTADGYVALRYGTGPGMELYSHTAAGKSTPVTVDVLEPEVIRALGDGIVAFTKREREHTWTKIGLDGQVAWSVSATTSDLITPIVWEVIDGDLVLASAISTTLVVDGTTYQPGYFVGVFDGASGALAQHIARDVVTPNGVGTPTGVALDETGVVLVGGFSANLTFVHLPWADGGRRVDYIADVINGYCLQPGVQCVGQRATVTSLGDGRFASAWTQTNPTAYDGAAVDGVSPKRAVSGVFTPDP